ncbi:hypothetical protein [Haloferula sp.]|uniref:hypothetical protein n=1 Tax=Haloferula sp. TaxID=2497595 RepID=UPI003C73EB09
MNPESDKHRLLARAASPSGKDDHDPEIAAAHEAIAADPELAAELTAERGADLAISESLRATEPPPELEEQLLSTLRETRRAAVAANIVEAPPNAFSRRHWLGMAAAAALTTGIAYTWHRSKQLPLSRLVATLANYSIEGVTLSLMSMEKEEVVDWLVSNQAPRASTLPPALDALGRKGCHIYDIEGHRVSLECFLLPGMREIHLFTTPTAGLSGAPSDGSQPKLSSIDSLTSAVWSQGENTMILLTSEPVEMTRSLLGTA